MAQVIMPSVQGATTIEEVKNTVGIMIKELSWLLQNLDTRNVNELNAEVIIAGSIVADKIAAGAITADKIEARAVTADKISVQELSAITARMGKLTSGELYGAYIATKENEFPRAEMSNLENLFAAFLDARNYISVEANYSGSPSLNFITGGAIKGRLQTLMGSLGIDSIGDLYIGATGGVDISPGSNSNLRIPSFGRVVSATGANLGFELDKKATAGISTSMSGSANGGIPIGTVFKDVNGVNHTWNGVPLHSHAQN